MATGWRRGRGRGPGSGRRAAAPGISAGGWWHVLDGDDVISLEPLCELEYEPFALPSAAAACGGVDEVSPSAARCGVDAYNYFDGKILSHYLISSGNFSHPVSRRPLSRHECEALDAYMRMHQLGDAGVTHAFDLNADTSEKSRHHLAALQQEAADILSSLFSSVPGGGARERRRRADTPSPATLGSFGRAAAAQGAGHNGGGHGVSGWDVIDDHDDGQDQWGWRGGRTSQDEIWISEEQMWPSLPPAPARSPRSTAAPTVTGDKTETSSPGREGAAEPEGRVPCPPPSQPPHGAGRREVLAPGLLRLCGLWTATAMEALGGGEGESAEVRVALERQGGGEARDKRFQAEVAWVERYVKDGGGNNTRERWGGLEAMGFVITKVSAVRCAEWEQAFGEEIRQVTRELREREGWGVYSVAGQAADDGAYYAWNHMTGESRWALDDIHPGTPLCAEGQADGSVRTHAHNIEKGNEAEAGRVCGSAEWGGPWILGSCGVVIRWSPLTVKVSNVTGLSVGEGRRAGGKQRQEASLLDVIAGSVAKGELRERGEGLEGCRLEAALVLACRRAGVQVDGKEVECIEDIPVETELHVLASCFVVPSTSDAVVARAGRSAAALPMLMVSVKRLRRSRKPRVSPSPGVHEGEIQVEMHAERGATILFSLDGSDPSCLASRSRGAVQTYKAPFRLGQGSFEVKAIARTPDHLDSHAVTALFLVKKRCLAPSIKYTPVQDRHAPAGGQVHLATPSWSVVPDAKIHFSIYVSGAESVEATGEEGAEPAAKEAGAEEMVVQGFYQQPIDLPVGLGGKSTLRIRAVALHPSMLPSETASAVFPLHPRPTNDESSTPMATGVESAGAGGKGQEDLASPSEASKTLGKCPIPTIVGVLVAVLAVVLSFVQLPQQHGLATAPAAGSPPSLMPTPSPLIVQGESPIDESLASEPAGAQPEGAREPTSGGERAGASHVPVTDGTQGSAQLQSSPLSTSKEGSPGKKRKKKGRRKANKG